jgi:hypothetical protein
MFKKRTFIIASLLLVVAVSSSAYININRKPKEKPEKICHDIGGTWRLFSDSCANNCPIGNSIGPRRCSYAITYGCDCGTSKCWDTRARKCVDAKK